MLDVEKIRELIDMMVGNDLSEITLRDGTEEISLRRSAAQSAHSVPAQHPAMTSGPALPLADGPVAEVEAVEEDEVELIPIASPMVGTFYAASSPESPPFVQVGARISPESTVCIVEAMKVFNEIKAELAGVIERILVKNASVVEYGQPLFLVRPA